MPKQINFPFTCFLILFATLSIAGVGGMIVVSLRQQIAATAQHLQIAETETTRLGRLNEELSAKIAMLESPQALKIVAQRLGMQPAKLDQYRLMGQDKTSKTAVAAHVKKSAKGSKTLVSVNK